MKTQRPSDRAGAVAGIISPSCFPAAVFSYPEELQMSDDYMSEEEMAREYRGRMMVVVYGMGALFIAVVAIGFWLA